jgi:hypothetical protein
VDFAVKRIFETPFAKKEKRVIVQSDHSANILLRSFSCHGFSKNSFLSVENCPNGSRARFVAEKSRGLYSHCAEAPGMIKWRRLKSKGEEMSKAVMMGAAALALSACVGWVDGRSASGKTTHDLYVLHPAITISGYLSRL